MVNVANYVEFKVKALIKELAENFDIRKCGELYQSVGDLLKLESEAEFKKTGFIVPNGGPLPDPVADAIHSAVEKAQEPPPKKRGPRRLLVGRGEQKMIIELMLDRFFEGAKNGQTKFSFYANDFGCSEEYLQKNIGSNINSSPYKRKRFPDLKITCRSIPGGIDCYIGRNK